MSLNFVELPYPLTRYVIRQDGLIIDTLTGLHVIPTLGPNSLYYGVTIWKDDDDSHSVTMHLHRLLALAFKPIPEGYNANQLQVNHINGNKLDNRLENLEWVTQADNIRHAFATGLQNHEHKVAVISESGERREFKNQKLASEFIGVTPGSLSAQIKLNRPCAGYIVRRI